MRRVREMLKLKREGELSTQEVARRTGVARSTLREMFARFEQSGLAWPIPGEISDKELEVRLYGERGSKHGHRRQAEPDWAMLNRELKRKHVTLQILWDEYIEAEPEGYKYSRFCELYRSWEGRRPVTMRQTYLGGEKLFVDYAGDTVPVIVDPGEWTHPRRPHLRGGDGRIQPVVRLGKLEREAHRLGRGPRAGLRLLRRRTGPGGAGQAADRAGEGRRTSAARRDRLALHGPVTPLNHPCTVVAVADPETARL